MNKVILYSTGCPMCKILKTKLDQKNIEYQVCENVDIMMEKGFQTVPMLEIDDKLYNFREAVTWVNNL